VNPSIISRRQFLTGAGVLAGIGLVGPTYFKFGLPLGSVLPPRDQMTADYTLHIRAAPIEIARNGSLLRFLSGITHAS
jgi:hypothetical protein